MTRYAAVVLVFVAVMAVLPQTEAATPDRVLRPSANGSTLPQTLTGGVTAPTHNLPVVPGAYNPDSLSAANAETLIDTRGAQVTAEIRVTANSFTGGTTFRLRDNQAGADVPGGTVTIPGGATGTFTFTTTSGLTYAQRVLFQIVGPAGSAGQSLSYATIMFGWNFVHNTLVANAPEPIGINCRDSGTKTTTGLDDGNPSGTADNGILEAGEIQFTFYTCRGRDAGMRYTYTTNTADNDPGVGTLKFDVTTLAAATVLRISETDGDAGSVGAWINAWDYDTGPIKGTLYVRKNNEPGTFAIFDVTSTVSDNGGWGTVGIQYAAGAGAFTNGDIVKLTFAPQGAAGQSGLDLEAATVALAPVLLALLFAGLAHRSGPEHHSMNVVAALIAIALTVYSATAYPWAPPVRIVAYVAALYLGVVAIQNIMTTLKDKEKNHA
jgi:hypothetical protein